MAGQSTLKKPAAAKARGQSTSSSLKRPAASMSETLNDLRNGVKGNKDGDNDAGDNGSSEEPPSQDDDGTTPNDGSKRSKGKALKFAAMKDKLPPHIIELYDKGALEKSSPRAFRTQIVNSLFKRTKQGRYILKAERPLFEEARQIYEKRWGNEKQKSFPRSVIKGLYFGNSEPALQAAIDCGDVYVVTSASSGGKEMYAFHQEEVGIERQVFRE